MAAKAPKKDGLAARRTAFGNGAIWPMPPTGPDFRASFGVRDYTRGRSSRRFCYLF
jgi:hypothetical protein